MYIQRPGIGAGLGVWDEQDSGEWGMRCWYGKRMVKCVCFLMSGWWSGGLYGGIESSFLSTLLFVKPCIYHICQTSYLAVNAKDIAIMEIQMSFGFIVCTIQPILIWMWLRNMHALTGSNEETPQFETQSYLCRSSESNAVHTYLGWQDFRRNPGLTLRIPQRYVPAALLEDLPGDPLGISRRAQGTESYHARLALRLPNCRYR